MSIRHAVIETLEIVKEDYHFSGDLGGQNVGVSLDDLVLPKKILPVRNPCYTMPLLIGRILSAKGVKSRICIARRESWKKLLPMHILLSVDDEALRRWYIDFIFDGKFALKQDFPPDSSDRPLEAWEYRGEDTLSELLRENNSLYYILLHTKSLINRLLPRDWRISKNKRKSIYRAERLNLDKKTYLLPCFGEVE